LSTLKPLGVNGFRLPLLLNPERERTDCTRLTAFTWSQCWRVIRFHEVAVPMQTRGRTTEREIAQEW
jgi:hypothetical protein